MTVEAMLVLKLESFVEALFLAALAMASCFFRSSSLRLAISFSFLIASSLSRFIIAFNVFLNFKRWRSLAAISAANSFSFC